MLTPNKAQQLFEDWKKNPTEEKGEELRKLHNALSLKLFTFAKELGYAQPLLSSAMIDASCHLLYCKDNFEYSKDPREWVLYKTEGEKMFKAFSLQHMLRMTGKEPPQEADLEEI